MKKVTIILTLMALTYMSFDSKNVSSNGLAVTSTEGPEKVVIEFYKWYLVNYYNTDFKIITPNEKLKDGILFLDTTNYMKLIRECGFFSQAYINNQITTFSKCNSSLIELDLKVYNDCGCSPADLVSGCDFMHYYNWLFHQGETTQDIKVKNSEITKKGAAVDIELLSKKGDSKGYQTLRVTLENEADKWKIKEIENAP